MAVAFKPQRAVMTLLHPTTKEPEFPVIIDEDSNIVTEPNLDENGEVVLRDSERIEDRTQTIRVVSYMSNEAHKTAKALVEERKNKEELTDEDLSDELKTMVASCIVGWSDNGIFTEPYSPEEAKNILLDPENGWIFEQVSTFLGDRSNFFQKVGTS